MSILGSDDDKEGISSIRTLNMLTSWRNSIARYSATFLCGARIAFYDVRQTTRHHPCSPPPLPSNPAVVSSFPEPAIELPSPTNHCCKPDCAHNPIRKLEVPTTTRTHSVRPLAHNFGQFCFPSVVPTPRTQYINFVLGKGKTKEIPLWRPPPSPPLALRSSSYFRPTCRCYVCHCYC